MYCRMYQLSEDLNSEFVFQARKLDPLTGRYSSIYEREGVKTRQFPVRDTVEKSLNDLESVGCDGEVMRYVRTKSVVIDTPCSPSITAGLAARLWIDTSATDGDTERRTKEELESDGFLVCELYEGPFSLDESLSIIEGLKDKIGHLSIIKLGSAYNAAQVINFKPTRTARIKSGRLYIAVTREEMNHRIDEWHEGKDEIELCEYLGMPFEAFSICATTPSKCVFKETA